MMCINQNGTSCAVQIRITLVIDMFWFRFAMNNVYRWISTTSALLHAGCGKTCTLHIKCIRIKLSLNVMSYVLTCYHQSDKTTIEPTVKVAEVDSISLFSSHFLTNCGIMWLNTILLSVKKWDASSIRGREQGQFDRQRVCSSCTIWSSLMIQCISFHQHLSNTL